MLVLDSDQPLPALPTALYHRNNQIFKEDQRWKRFKSVIFFHSVTNSYLYWLLFDHLVIHMKHSTNIVCSNVHIWVSPASSPRQNWLKMGRYHSLESGHQQWFIGWGRGLTECGCEDWVTGDQEMGWRPVFHVTWSS